ncbi:MAG TPA: FAD-dependent oxidoreductase [Drouetiella sp.]
MRQESSETPTFWSEKFDIPQFPTLTEAKCCDVCVVGGGITGLMTAFMLATEGKKVIVVDDGPVCRGETIRTTGHVTNVLDMRFHTLIAKHGLENARIAFQAYRAGMDQIASIINTQKIACDFEKVDGYLILSPETKLNELQREEKAANDVGIANVSLTDSPLKRHEVTPALKFPSQYQINIAEFMDGLIDACLDLGVEIFANTRMGGIEDGDVVVVKKENQENVSVSASSIVIATNSPILGVGVHLKQSAYRTYVIAGPVAINSVPKGLFWDTEEPYHYVRTQPIEDDLEHELLIVGGEDHKTGQEDDPQIRFARLEEWTRTWVGNFKSIDYKWSGQVYEPVDGLPYVGKQPGSKGIYIATGASGVGLSFAGFACQILNDLICGRANSSAALFDPTRLPLTSPIDFVKETVNAAVQYFDFVSKPDVTSVMEIHPGEGAIVTRGGEKIAVCRDDHGNICERSAICPHMGGVVQWNSLEKTWDCPVHGSRFDMSGTVLNGPAKEGLAEAKHKLDDEGEQESKGMRGKRAS